MHTAFITFQEFDLAPLSLRSSLFENLALLPQYTSSDSGNIRLHYLSILLIRNIYLNKNQRFRFFIVFFYMTVNCFLLEIDESILWEYEQNFSSMRQKYVLRSIFANDIALENNLLCAIISTMFSARFK